MLIFIHIKSEFQNSNLQKNIQNMNLQYIRVYYIGLWIPKIRTFELQQIRVFLWLFLFVFVFNWLIDIIINSKTLPLRNYFVSLFCAETYYLSCNQHNVSFIMTMFYAGIWQPFLNYTFETSFSLLNSLWTLKYILFNFDSDFGLNGCFMFLT